jgi:homoserine kinase
MSFINAVTIKVPATTANLGPGFDCIGAALTLYNQFSFTVLESAFAESCRITVSGLEAERVRTDKTNLAYQALTKVFQHLDLPQPAIQLEIQLGIPLSRGLGSSATAIAAGIIAGNYLAGSPLSSQALIKLAVEIEGHPDNIIPAILGGCRLAASCGISDQEWAVCDVPWHSTVIPIVAIPDFELSTQEARKVLPLTYSRADAIFNTAHLGLLLRGLETGQEEWLRAALQDRMHQPYRQALIPGYKTVYTAAIAAEAYGMVISGAGPTLLALADIQHAQAVQSAMTNAWSSSGIPALVMALQLDSQGTQILS